MLYSREITIKEITIYTCVNIVSILPYSSLILCTDAVDSIEDCTSRIAFFFSYTIQVEDERRNS